MSILRDLGGGLVLRRATVSDTEALVEFNARVHSDKGEDQPEERVAAWTRDLMERPHPTFDVGDFTIVENTSTGKIVSTMNLISQTWTYGGVPFGVGRPELVGTLPQYRNRGLVRAQFEVVHRWSAERGEWVQAITGIPYYYRLFGYEMALSLGGGRAGFKPHIPKLEVANDGAVEPYHVRPADQRDLDFIDSLYEQNNQLYLVCCMRDDALWRYELMGKSEKNVNRYDLRVIETPAGDPAGYLAHPFFRWGDMMAATAYELAPGFSWAAVTPSVIRYLQATGEHYPSESGEGSFEAFGFWLGSDHPVYQLLLGQLPRVRPPYAWYLRLPDLPGFLHHVSSVIERRLEKSLFAGHTGEVKITFYRTGLRLVFENGRLVQAESWQPEPQNHSGDAAFPGLTFLQALFGYRTIDELKYAFPDCWTGNDTVHALLNTLFPKQVSNVWPVS